MVVFDDTCTCSSNHFGDETTTYLIGSNYEYNLKYEPCIFELREIWSKKGWFNPKKIQLLVIFKIIVDLVRNRSPCKIRFIYNETRIYKY